MTPRTFRWPGLLLALALYVSGASHVLAELPGDDGQDRPAAEPTPQELLIQRHNTLVPHIKSLWQRGEDRRAYAGLQELLALYQQIYPPEQYPAGHRNVVRCYGDLCRLAEQLDDTEALLRYSQEGLAMCRKLYTETEFPRGHLETARMLANVGHGWMQQDCPGQARTHLLRAIGMSDDLARHGQPALDGESIADLHRSVAATCADEGDFLQAAQYTQLAVQRCQNLPEAYPYLDRLHLRGRCLREHGRALIGAGDYRAARTALEQAYDCSLRVYLARRSPTAHLALVDSHLDLGTLYRYQSDLPRAKRHLLRARQELERAHGQVDRATQTASRIREQLLAIAQVERDFRWADPGAENVEMLERMNRHSDLRSMQVVQTPLLLVPPANYSNWGASGVVLPLSLYVAKSFLPIGAGTIDPSIGFSESLSAARRLTISGKYREAYVSFANSLSFVRELYDSSRYRSGHPILARVLHYTATQLWLLGETESAAALYREAMLMNERLFPPADYPRGHRQLMTAYSAWGNVLERDGDLEGAAEYFAKAYRIACEQFPAAEYLRGHDELALVWRDLGRLERDRGQFDAALKYFQDALASYQSRYDASDPDGQLLVALTRSELGRTHAAAGDWAAAERFMQQSLAMRRRLFAPDDYPDGHPSLATALRDLGRLCIQLGQSERAFRLLSQSARIEQGVAESFVGGSSEGLLLNLAARKFESLDGLLDAWSGSERPAMDAYQYVWRRRGFVPRLIAQRQNALRQLASNGPTADQEAYFEVRRQLSRALLVPASNDWDDEKSRVQEVRRLNAHKEAIEARLTQLLDSKEQRPGFSEQTPQALIRQLPQGAVLVDFVRYRTWAGYGAQEVDSPGNDMRLMAFVLARDRPVVCVRLGDARQIEDLAQRWHAAVSSGQSTSDGQALRELVWDPVCECFPDATESVYVGPDGALSLVPWNALPLPGEMALLIERYTIATVPHGMFLLDALAEAGTGDFAVGKVLAVGDLDFGVPPDAQDSKAFGLKEVVWRPLAGAQAELENLVRAAGGRECLQITGSNATTDAIMDRLPECRWAHFATHGFFLDDSLRQTLHLATGRDDNTALTHNRSRSSVFQRNPFLRSGLALSGANELGIVDQRHMPVELTGILTAEAIAMVDCRHLHLVVLSACESGRGDVVHGDGVFGIQTAFHVAGARNVIASLWKVDDQATVELMDRFYDQLWQGHMSPAAALRAAQLELVHRSRTSSEQPRGPELSKTVPLPKRPGGKHVDAASQARHWAAFALSGPGF